MERRRRLRWLLAATAGLTAIGTAGAALMPTLLKHSPLLLIAVSPLPRHLVMAAPLVPIVPFVVVATLRRMLTSTVVYGLGHTYGEDGIAWVRQRYPSVSGALDMLRKAFDFAAPLVIFIAPGPLIAALAGAVRVPLWLFLAAATAGHALWAVLTYRVGEALGVWLAPVLQFVFDHVALTTLACVVLVGGYALWRRRTRKRVLHELDAQVERERERGSLDPSTSTSDS